MAWAPHFDLNIDKVDDSRVDGVMTFGGVDDQYAKPK